MNLRPAHLLYEYLNLTQFSLHKAMMTYKLKRISPRIRGTWLDIGAGDQPYRKYFAGADQYLTTNTKIHYHADEIEYIDKYTTFWIEDGKMLPVDDNSMDGVACFQVLSVIDMPTTFFKEIYRVLKPGGKLVLTTDFLYPAWSEVDRYRHTEFSLRQLAERTGFEVENIESFGGFGSTIYKMYMRFVRTLPQIWKQKLTFRRAITMIPYLLLLVLLPLASLIGILIFNIEKNSTTNTDFTFNLLLLATKDPDQ